MKTSANPKPRPDVAESHNPLTQSGMAVSEVLTSVAHNIQLIQSNAGAEMFTRSLDSLVPAFSPNGAPYWFQQLPLLYRLQATSLMKSAAETFSELLRAQQALMEVASQSSLQSVKESADSTTQALRKLYSRRVSSEVIQFPDRRAA